MANNFTETSSWLSVEQKDVERAREIVARVISEIEEEDEGGCTIIAEVEDKRGYSGVWFHSESFYFDHMADIAQALLDELEIDRPFAFSWSYTCSKPRIDGFGGGACVLRRDEDPYIVDAIEHIFLELKAGR